LRNDNNYENDLLSTAIIKPKPWALASNDKLFSSDGVKVEEPSCTAPAFVPKKSDKKLVTQNFTHSLSRLTLISDVSSSQPTRIDISISLMSPQNVSNKSPGDSMCRDVPSPVDVTNI